MPETTTDWRQVADPLADEAAAALHERGQRGDLLLLAQAGAREDARLERFFAHVDEVIADAAAGLYAPGREMGIRHAPRTFFALFGSLVESFARADGAKVLVRTGRLERDTIVRTYETASMIRDVLLPGGLEPTGRGTEALVRVRLLHAMVRRYLKKGGFDEEAWGAPINQEDMLHTLLMFDRVLIRGVRALGGAVDPLEDESWCALWGHAGRLLGVDEALIPRSVSDATRAYHRLRAQCFPDEDSRRLTQAVLGTFAGKPPFFFPRRVMFALCRVLVGHPLAAELGLGSPGRLDVALDQGAIASRLFGHMTAKVPGAHLMALGVGHAFVEANRYRVLRWMGSADYAFRTA